MRLQFGRQIARANCMIPSKFRSHRREMHFSLSHDDSNAMVFCLLYICLWFFVSGEKPISKLYTNPIVSCSFTLWIWHLEFHLIRLLWNRWPGIFPSLRLNLYRLRFGYSDNQSGFLNDCINIQRNTKHSLSTYQEVKHFWAFMPQHLLICKQQTPNEIQRIEKSKPKLYQNTFSAKWKWTNMKIGFDFMSQPYLNGK